MRFLPSAAVAALASYALRESHRLASLPLAQFEAGQLDFGPVQ